MLRCYISDKDHLKIWFAHIQNAGFTTKSEIANYLNISARTLTDWQRAKYGIPKSSFLKLETFYPYPFGDHLVMEDSELKKISGRKGGLATYKKGEFIGTIESRRKGGYASLLTHKLRRTGFFLLKECGPFAYTTESAELTAAIIGDGHLAPGQIEFTLDTRERQYAKHLLEMIESVTGYKAVIRERTDTYFSVSISGKQIAREFNRLGIVYGNKTRNQNSIPEWVKTNYEFKKAFLRGIFDTDGCLYTDSHIINGKEYQHWGISIASHNPNFLIQLGGLLESLGFHPTRSTKHRIILRRQNEIALFMKTVNPVNQKHIKDYPHKQ